MSNQYQYKHCVPTYRKCQCHSSEPSKIQSALAKMRPTILHPNPFAPHGGAREWKSNSLLLKDQELRCKAGVQKLDAGIKELYTVNPVPKL